MHRIFANVSAASIRAIAWPCAKEDAVQKIRIGSGAQIHRIFANSPAASILAGIAASGLWIDAVWAFRF